MNLLLFQLERQFNEELNLIANNEVDLEDYLITLGYKNIIFYDLNRNHGSCSLEDEYGKKTAKCFYINKI